MEPVHGLIRQLNQAKASINQLEKQNEKVGEYEISIYMCVYAQSFTLYIMMTLTFMLDLQVESQLE